MPRLFTLSALVALAACQGATLPEPADTAACDEILASRTVTGEILLHGTGPVGLPDAVLETPGAWSAYRAEHGLPALDVNWEHQALHVATLWSDYDCDYLDDTDGGLRVVVLEDDALGVIAPIAMSSSDCHREPRALYLIAAIPADEPGAISAFCPIR